MRKRGVPEPSVEKGAEGPPVTETKSPSGVPWSKVHFKAGARAKLAGEHPQVNPWTPDTHAFESWKAGYEQTTKLEQLGKGACGGCGKMRTLFRNPRGPIAQCRECVR
jgi:hypothetical protein